MLQGILSASPIVEIIDTDNVRFTFLGISEVCKPRVNEDKNVISFMWNKQQVDLTYLDTGEPNLSLTMKGKQVPLNRTSVSVKPVPFKSDFADFPVLNKKNLLGRWQIVLHLSLIHI